MKSPVPAIFVRSVAGGDRRYATILWDRPARVLGGFTPREFWEGESGPFLSVAVRQQAVVTRMRAAAGKEYHLPEPLAPEEAFAFYSDEGITVDGLALGTPVRRAPQSRTLPSYRPRLLAPGRRRC